MLELDAVDAQMVMASVTQAPSHCCRSKRAASHTAAAHGLQLGLRSPPCAHNRVLAVAARVAERPRSRRTPRSRPEPAARLREPVPAAPPLPPAPPAPPFPAPPAPVPPSAPMQHDGICAQTAATHGSGVPHRLCARPWQLSSQPSPLPMQHAASTSQTSSTHGSRQAAPSSGSPTKQTVCGAHTGQLPQSVAQLSHVSLRTRRRRKARAAVCRAVLAALRRRMPVTAADPAEELVGHADALPVPAVVAAEAVVVADQVDARCRTRRRGPPSWQTG